MMKSNPDRYGAVPVTIHWLTAILIPILLISGFRAAHSLDALTKAAILRVHIPVAVAVLILTLLRLVWWIFIDQKPAAAAGTPPWQDGVANLVHFGLYVVIFGLAASGIGLILDSGAAPALFGHADASLPNFRAYPPRRLHGVAARLLIALLLTHVAAALWHHFIRCDGLLGRMWYARRMTPTSLSRKQCVE